MFDWKQIEDNAKDAFIEKANSLNGRSYFQKDNTVVEETKLPFYQGLKLLKLEGGIGRLNKIMLFLFNDDDLIKIDGDHESIYDANNVEMPKLNISNAFDYISFFIGSLMTENGKFQVVESMEDVVFTAEPKEEVVEILPSLIKKAQIEEKAESFEAVFNMFYANILFETKAVLHKNGKLELVEEKALLENVPTRELDII